MILRYCAPFFLLAVFIADAFAQTGAITGRVYSGVDPVIQANVGLQGTSRGGVTDDDGKFSITRVPAGSYTLAVSAVGFKKLEQEISIKEGETLELKLQME